MSKNIRVKYNRDQIDNVIKDINTDYNLNLIENKSDSNYQTGAIKKGNNNTLSILFFSKKNTNGIQKLVKFKIYQDTGYIIDSQDETELYIIMSEIFDTYTEYPDALDPIKYKKELLRLNEMVVDKCYGIIHTQLLGYFNYLVSISGKGYASANANLRTPVSARNEKVLKI